MATNVPAALQGIFTNGVRSGVFEATNVANKQYVTTLEFVNAKIALADDAGHSAWFASEIYDFPEGLIVYEGAVVDLTATASPTAGALDATHGLTAIFDSHFALGSVAKTDDDATTLTSTMVDLVASTAQGAATAGVGTAKAISTTTEAPKTKDGTSAAFKLFLNWLVTDNTQDVTTCPSSLILNGTVTFQWRFLGDK